MIRQHGTTIAAAAVVALSAERPGGSGHGAGEPSAHHRPFQPERRVRPFEITDPEEGLGRPADLSLRGLAGPGGGPGAQATFGDPSRSPAA